MHGVSGNLRERRHIRLVARSRIQPPHHVEPLEIQLFPSQVAGHEEPHVIRDQTGQCQSGTRHGVSAVGQQPFLPKRQGVQFGEDVVGVHVGHIRIDPAFRDHRAVQVEHDGAVAVRIHLQTDAAVSASDDEQRRAGAPIGGLYARRPLAHDAVVDKHGNQQGHGRLGQSRLFGQFGAAHRFGGAQQRADDHREIVVA